MIVECVLIEDCLAPKRVGNRADKRPFRRGQRVRGRVENIALTPDHQVLALRTLDGYIIPEPFLNVLGAVEEPSRGGGQDDIQEAEVIDDNEYLKSDRVNKVMNTYGKIKASNLINKNALKSRHAVNFALVGGAVGLVYAMLRGKNKMLFATLGVVGGGILGNYYGNKIKGDENTESEEG